MKGLAVFVLVTGTAWGVVEYDDELRQRIQQLKRERKIVVMLGQSAVVSGVEVDLGELLFHDPVLSRNRNVSCSSCHNPQQAFGNAQRFATGTHGDTLARHVPHLYNLVFNRSFFWDGRASSLEEQLELVLASKMEMDMSFREVVQRLGQNPTYVSRFSEIYKEGITKRTIIKAIVAFERSLTTGPGRYDLYMAGDTTQFTAIEREGLRLFVGKANCIACHNGINLTDNSFHNVGVRTEDLGRHVFDKIGMRNEFESTPYPFFSMYKAFKTPSLRHVAFTAPYFHDGSRHSLTEIIEFYNRGGDTPGATGLAKEIQPLNLSPAEREALEAFLTTLSP